MKNYFSFKTSDGLTIKGYSVSSLNKNKGVIALIHGMGEHGMRYAHVASFFASNDVHK
jgi:alpha-beta hydrolase superfamily lysophospholipase